MKKLIALGLAMLMALTFITVALAEEPLAYSSAWKIKVSSDYGDTAKKAFDGNPATYWHTNYVAEGGTIKSHDECPHTMTVTFPSIYTVSGWRYTPRTDNATGTVRAYEIYTSKDGKAFNKVYTGSFTWDTVAAMRESKEAYWNSEKVRAVRIVVTDGEAGYATAAEIEFLSDSAETVAGQLYSYQPSWSVEASDAWEATPITKAFDGNPATYWHSEYTVENGAVVSHIDCPHTITVTLPEVIDLCGWRYTPRTDNGAGVVYNYTIHASEDGVNFTDAYVGNFAWEGNAGAYKAQDAMWTTVKAKVVKIEITASNGGYGTAAEIAFMTGNITVEEEKYEGVTDTGVYKLSRKKWLATASSARSGNSVSLTLDGSEKSYWHSDYVAVDGRVTDKDSAPYYLEYTLPEVTNVSGVSFMPREETDNGMILEMNIEVSDSDDGEYMMIREGATFGMVVAEQNIPFAANLPVKRIRVTVVRGGNGFAAMAEFYAWAEDDEKEQATYENYEELADLYDIYYVDGTEFIAECVTPSWAEHIPNSAFDGEDKSYWQTETCYGEQLLDIDMGRPYTVNQIVYTPRQSQDMHGCWLKVSVEGSLDGISFHEIVPAVRLDRDLSDKILYFDQDETIQYVTFHIIDYNANRVSAAEIRFGQSKAAYDAAKNELSESYVLKIGSPTISVNHAGIASEKTLDVAPFIINGSTMIPLRGLLEEMGASITWNGENDTIGIEKGAFTMTLQIWNYLVYVADPRYGNIKYTLRTAPIIRDSRTFVPIRFVSEVLGYTVDWDGETQTVSIH